MGTFATLEEAQEHFKNDRFATNAGMTVDEIAMKTLEGLEPNILDDFEVNYKCDCSRDRVSRALQSIGEADLREMAKDEITEVKCHFCDKAYKFTSKEIEALIRK